MAATMRAWSSVICSNSAIEEIGTLATAIMKVSYNRGADLMTCLSAVKTGSTDCEQGLVEEVNTCTELGVPKTSVFPMDGAGSNDQGRSSPAALASFSGPQRKRPMRRRYSIRFRSSARAGPWPTCCRTRPRQEARRSRPATAS